MRGILVALLWLGCAAPPGPTHPRLLAGPIPKAAGCPSGPEVTDALGEKVRLGANPEGLTTVIVFLSRGAADDAAELIRQLDERLLNRPIQMIGVVDLRRYAGVFRRVAERRLKSSAAESRDMRRERRQRHGIDASPRFVDRWHVIGDFDGKMLDRFQISAEPRAPVAFVVAACGQVSGPFHDLGATLEAVDHASARTARSPAFSRHLRAAR